MPPAIKKICTNCEAPVDPVWIATMTVAVEWVLLLAALLCAWFSILLAGLLVLLTIILTIIRIAGKKEACPRCKQAGLVALTSPAGQRILKTHKTPFRKKQITRPKQYRLKPTSK